jgi:hypothetical protein
MTIRRPRLKRAMLLTAKALKGRPVKRAARTSSPAYPSVPKELAGKWIARGPGRQIVASGDTLSEVMDEVASKGIEGVSYGRVPRFDRQQVR